MIEPDDRLAGDPVWELFPSLPAKTPPPDRLRTRTTIAALIAAAWLIFPPAAVFLACLWASQEEFRSGWQVARTIPDKAGRQICAVFAYAWGAWKFGVTAFGLIFVVVILATLQPTKPRGVPPAGMTAILLWMGGLLASAALTALGLVQTYRAGMRVWIGEGINQARTLLLAMLMAGFAVFVILPLCFWMTGIHPPARDHPTPALVIACSILFGGPVVMLIALDRFTRRIVADRPGKFGIKVPTVGKWES